MYTFQNSNSGSSIFSASVPPSADDLLPEDFKEISRIHFYLGNKPITFMADAVKNASLDEINIGKPQLYFAVREINDFLKHHLPELNFDGKSNSQPGCYIQKAIDEILQHTQKILNHTIQHPGSAKNIPKLETMLTLTHEVMLLQKELNKQNLNLNNIDTEIDNIKTSYTTILKLKQHYDVLKDLGSFNSFKEKAQKSLEIQCTESVTYDLTGAKHIYTDHDDWFATLTYLRQEKDKAYDHDEVSQLKTKMTELLTATEQLCSNGILNYINSYVTALIFDIDKYYDKVMTDTVSQYQQKIDMEIRLSKISHSFKKESKDKLKDLQDNKEQYIQKIDADKKEFDIVLKYRTQEHQILTDCLNTVKKQVLKQKIETEPTITFTGDLKSSFVVGTPNTGDFVLLVHNDPFVSVKNAIFAKVITKEAYNTLVDTNNLVFTEELKDAPGLHGSNFWSFGQFLNEIKSPVIQDMFLKGQYQLIDKTDNSDLQFNKAKTKKVEMADLDDDIPF